MGGSFISRYEQRKNGKIFASESWNSSDGNVEDENYYPANKEISEEDAWLDERGQIKE